MKKIGLTLLSLMATTAFAAPDVSHLPKYMRLSQAPQKLVKPVKAQMGCDLYSYDENFTPTFLATQNSSIFTVGTPTTVEVSFPAPYQGIKARFEHYNVEFAIDQFSTERPLISSAMIRDNINYSDYKNATFAIENAKTGSQITLDAGYVYNDKTMLYSVCSIVFIK